MLKLGLYPDVPKFLKTVDRKHAGQICVKLIEFLSNPEPHDSALLKGTNGLLMRADVGEYRIVCRVQDDVLLVPLVGRRNDDEIYKQVRRKGL